MSRSASHSAGHLEVDGVIFDCDGVLVDSAASIDRSWRTWADTFGLSAERVLEEAPGRPALATPEAWLSSELVDAGCNLIEGLEVADAHSVGAVAGARDLLAVLPRDR